LTVAQRFVAVLAENFAGKWPFWLSPRQAVVLPVAAPFKQYATKIADKLSAAGLYADADLSDFTLNKRIRNAEIAQYNFILVVGQEEQDTQSVNVRNRDDVGVKGKTETIKLDEVLARMLALKQTRKLENRL
jgi:threonyl-tRNA synthetase